MRTLFMSMPLWGRRFAGVRSTGSVMLLVGALGNRYCISRGRKLSAGVGLVTLSARQQRKAISFCWPVLKKFC